MILVGRHGREFGLGEDEGSEILRLRGVLCPLVDVDHVEARLVSVHGIQNDLQRRRRDNQFSQKPKTAPHFLSFSSHDS